MLQVGEATMLAPFEIWEVMLDDSTIKFFEPLVLTPARMPHDPDEPGDVEYWEVEMPELMISTFGTDYEKIHNGILSDIRDAWKHIVAIPDNRLSQNGKKIKQNYLAIAEEIFDE